jgi:PAS domain S-box-containing protein
MSVPVHSEARILYADDTEAQRYAVAHVLRRAGFEVIEAESGDNALDLVRCRPDLVILDVNLPDLSGIEVCRRIKSGNETSRIPVLHVSATMVSTEARVAGLDGGADAYMVQPIAAEELIATVRALLRVRKAEEAFWESNQQYRQFFEATPLPCLVFNASDFHILAVNSAAVGKYRYSREEFIGMDLHTIVAKKDWELLSAAAEQGQSAASLGLRTHRAKDGSLFDVEITWSPLSLNGREATLVIVEDVTEKRKRETAERNEELQRLLLERVLHAQEDERRRIARELHDEAGQLMTSLLIGLRTLSDAPGLSEAREQAQHLREIASRAIGEVSRLARGLHSSILDDLGFETALRRYTDEFAATNHISVELDLSKGQPGVLPRHEQLNLYRIIQEALTNVARHADASHVRISFEAHAHELQVSIEDDGRGFSSSDAGHVDPTQHLGIEGMRQRAAMMAGSLQVIAAPRKGVDVRVCLPINSQRATKSVA